jgi:hypothetical protein
VNWDRKKINVSLETGDRYNRVNNAWNGVLKKPELSEGLVLTNSECMMSGIRWVHTCLEAERISNFAQFLGHTQLTTTERYITYADEDLKEGAEILSRLS